MFLVILNTGVPFETLVFEVSQTGPLWYKYSPVETNANWLPSDNFLNICLSGVRYSCSLHNLQQTSYWVKGVRCERNGGAALVGEYNRVI